MKRYILSRVGQAALVLWAAFTLSFVFLQLMPGDAILIKFLSPEYGLSIDQIREIRASYAIDANIFVQYVRALTNFLKGDFGYSIQAGVPVSAQLAANLPATLKLASLGFVAAVVLAVLIAFLSSLSPFAWLRNAIQSLPALFISIPVFWLGIVLIQLFSFRLKLVSIIAPGPWESMILPVATLSVPIAAPLAQILIRNIDETRTRPFVAVAIAKGATQTRVLRRHVARNAMLPALTIAGVLFGELLAGTVVTETVFGLNGIGGLTEKAVSHQDLPVLQAIVVMSALAFVAINLAVDLAYPLLDPPPENRPRGSAMSGGETYSTLPGTDAEDETAAGTGRPVIGWGRIPPSLVLAWAVIGTALLWALFPGVFTSHDPLQGVPGGQLKPPSALNLLGTDALARDLYARIVHGAVHSLSGAVAAVGVGLVIGTALGTIAGSVGGRIDAAIMRFVDVLLSIPTLLLSLSIIILLGFGTLNAALAVGATAIAGFARLMRAEVVRVRGAEFVEAAYGSGGTFVSVLWRHILPNSLSSVIAYSAVQFGGAILQISTLGFLGYGAAPPTPEWGLLIAEGRNYLATAWWLTVAPGVVVVAIVLSANRISQSIGRIGQ